MTRQTGARYFGHGGDGVSVCAAVMATPMWAVRRYYALRI